MVPVFDWILDDQAAAEASIRLSYPADQTDAIAEFLALLSFLVDGRGKKRAYGLVEEVTPKGKPSIRPDGRLTMTTSRANTPRLLVQRVDRLSNHFKFIAFYRANDYNMYRARLKADSLAYAAAHAHSPIFDEPMNNIVEGQNGIAWISANVSGGISKEIRY
jgi:hypothetical protein